MPSTPPQARPSFTQGTSYDDVKPGKPPIPIQTAPKPSQARLADHPMHKTASASSPDLTHPFQHSHSRLQEQEARRDSGLGTAASKRESKATTVGTDRTDAQSTTSGKFHSIRKVPSYSRMDRAAQTSQARSASRLSSVNTENNSLRVSTSLEPLPRLRDTFTSSPIQLPTFSLEDLSSPDALAFSKRGSLLVKGRRPSSSPSITPTAVSTVLGPVSPASVSERDEPATQISTMSTSPTSASRLDVPSPVPRVGESSPSSVSRVSLLPTRALSTEEETLSNRIRSMYEEGETASSISIPPEVPSVPDALLVAGEAPPSAVSASPASQAMDRQASLSNGRVSRSRAREEGELAGGLEDWNDVKSDEVDRYGFIMKKTTPFLSPSSPGTSHVSLTSTATAPAEDLQATMVRMSTGLQLASGQPRPVRSIRSRLGRSHSNAGSSRSAPHHDTDGRQSSAGHRTSRFLRPTSSQASHRTTMTAGSSRLRRAGNHLPHNKNRRVVDEAGDMLTLPPGLAELAEQEALNGKKGAKSMQNTRAKEREREEKWRKMAKTVKPSASRSSTTNGGGMQFSFDAANPKVISRAWKGIPDRWRSTAWWSFMETSAKKRPDSLSSEELIVIFHELVDQSCADDVQIDLDVPRTIGGHIMFRKRYRGGQRLLFRILHSLSLYFPDPGYVQGMAALAATFLCYFEEERAFVMLVRMWELRGLARMYRAGFDGLMNALDEFEKSWLAGGVVGEKLNQLGIPPTSYGTRWYLTLFNYSIPFSAQLRVWDVFLLLGDPDTLRQSPSSIGPRSASVQPTRAGNEDTVRENEELKGFHGGLDVLHATAAALIDGTREILLDSDFDNAMKTLTSWIPIKDDELLMRVAKVEYKYHKQKR